MIYLGIDNGLSGGIVALGPCVGMAPLLCKAMPIRQIDGNTEVCPETLSSVLTKLDGPVAAFVEECPKHSRSKAAMRSMAMSFGVVLGVLERFRAARDWRIVRVKSGAALTGWQRKMLGDAPKGETKAWALKAAKSIWPGEDWILPGRRVPHDGCIDAALIAEFGRRIGNGKR